MTAKELIHKYLSQGLTKDERFDLEKKALDDEFLDASWEGYQLHQNGDKHEVIPILENRLTQLTKQETKGRVVSFRKYWPMVAAASVAVLLGANFLFKSPSSEVTNGDVMAVVLEEEIEGGEIALTIESTEEENEVADLVITEAANSDATSTPRQKKQASSPSSVPESDLTSPPLDDIAAVGFTEKIASDPSAGQKLIIGAGAQGPNAIAATQPISNTTTTERKEPSVTNTPKDAEVVLALDDTGKNTTSLRIKDNEIAENTVRPIEDLDAIAKDKKGTLLSKKLNMNENARALSLDKADKTPSFSKRIKFNSETPDTAKASPSMGWTAFQKYIDDNARFDKDELFMRGLKPQEFITVPLVFELDDFNKSTDVKVRREQWGSAIEEEVIRVLKGSGTWSTLQPGEPIILDLKVKLRTKK